MIGDDLPDGCRHTNRPKFGGILLVLGKAEEVGVGKIRLDAWRYSPIVNVCKKEAQGLVDFGAALVDESDEKVQ